MILNLIRSFLFLDGKRTFAAAPRLQKFLDTELCVSRSAKIDSTHVLSPDPFYEKRSRQHDTDFGYICFNLRCPSIDRTLLYIISYIPEQSTIYGNFPVLLTKAAAIFYNQKSTWQVLPRRVNPFTVSHP